MGGAEGSPPRYPRAPEHAEEEGRRAGRREERALLRVLLFFRTSKKMNFEFFLFFAQRKARFRCFFAPCNPLSDRVRGAKRRSSSSGGERRKTEKRQFRTQTERRREREVRSREATEEKKRKWGEVKAPL